MNAKERLTHWDATVANDALDSALERLWNIREHCTGLKQTVYVKWTANTARQAIDDIYTAKERLAPHLPAEKPVTAYTS